MPQRYCSSSEAHSKPTISRARRPPSGLPAAVPSAPSRGRTGCRRRPAGTPGSCPATSPGRADVPDAAVPDGEIRGEQHARRDQRGQREAGAALDRGARGQDPGRQHQPAEQRAVERAVGRADRRQPHEHWREADQRGAAQQPQRRAGRQHQASPPAPGASTAAARRSVASASGSRPANSGHACHSSCASSTSTTTPAARAAAASRRAPGEGLVAVEGDEHRRQAGERRAQQLEPRDRRPGDRRARRAPLRRRTGRQQQVIGLRWYRLRAARSTSGENNASPFGRGPARGRLGQDQRQRQPAAGGIARKRGWPGAVAAELSPRVPRRSSRPAGKRCSGARR
jgi:hypothetical protein